MHDKRYDKIKVLTYPVKYFNIYSMDWHKICAHGIHGFRKMKPIDFHEPLLYEADICSFDWTIKWIAMVFSTDIHVEWILTMVIC